MASPRAPGGEQPSAGPERDRIAQAGSGQRLLVFGFWRGQLPELARLHFMSVAAALPSDSRYVLFTCDAIVPPPMQALLDSCGIEVVGFDLLRLMRELGVGRLVRRTPLSGRWGLVERLGRRSHAWARRLRWFGHDHSHWFTPRANLLLGGPPITSVILSNYARALISTIIPGHTLYTDIDVAFTRQLDWVFQQRSFVYRWGSLPFANGALISAHAESPIKRGALVEVLLREGTGRNWIMLSEPNCAACGLDILPCKRFDPRWSPGGQIGSNYSGFLSRTEASAAELAFLRDRFDTVHWHNKWNMAPEPGSPYDLWRRELEQTMLARPAQQA